jgi:membrane-bound lytic murein transglycosylase MltF
MRDAVASARTYNEYRVGVSVDLARAFAERLSVELELVVFDAAGKSVEAVSDNAPTLAFYGRSTAWSSYCLHRALRSDRGLLPRS